MAIGSFFHLEGVELVDQPCQGTACFVAAHRRPDRWARAEASEPRVYCLGRCYQGPAVASDTDRPRVEVHAPQGVVLGRVAAGGASTLGACRAAGGYGALEEALAATPGVIVDTIEASGLRGRGGAGYPTGRKWRAVAAAAAHDERGAVVVANGDEGDAGAYIDRFIMEDDPHAVVEGLAIAALAVDARHGYVYVRKEYPRAHASVLQAVADARAAGIIGPAVLGHGPAFDIEVVRGEGSYVCGEETALLNALEGRRPEVRARPPYPAERGLHGRPTLVGNVETFAAVPWIVSRGAAAYAAMGTPTSRGTKAVSLNSLFRRPGLYEVELGVPVREIVEGIGGGIAGGELRGLLIGGPLAGILPPHLLDTPFAFDELRAVGCEVGHGGIVAFDDHTSIAELVRHVFRFGAYESCGKCTPCREGTPRIEELFDAIHRGSTPLGGSAQRWHDIVTALAATSLCGHGSGLAAFAASVTTHYREELDACLA